MKEEHLPRLLAQLQELCRAWESKEVFDSWEVEFAQQIFAYAMRLYLSAVAHRAEDHEVPPPLPLTASFTATDCLIVANELLKYADIDIFELGLFRQYGVY
ncbi:MAG: hypothetical protein QN200_03720 [Armatimonadota bacterium]|nr:hypothetical protein [Armatimonadota bacterium]